MRISDWSSDVCSSDLERALGRAELPQRPAGDAQQAAQSVGGQAGRNMGPKVKTQHEALVALAPAARGGKQHVLAAQLATVGRQDQQAAVDQPVAARLAVVAHLQPATLLRLPPVTPDPRHTLAPPTLAEDCGR